MVAVYCLGLFYYTLGNLDPVLRSLSRPGGSKFSLVRPSLIDTTAKFLKPRPSLSRSRRFCVSAEVRRRFSIINRAKGKLIAASRDKKA